MSSNKSARSPLELGAIVVLVVTFCIFVYRDIQHQGRLDILAEQASAGAAEPGRQRVFEKIYSKGIWGRNAQGKGTSGHGSTVASTKIYRAFLSEFLSTFNIRSVVDAGCGDWEFSHLISWEGIDYRGYDIVASIVEEDNKRYGAPNIRFFSADIVKEDLPPADLIIVKDVLQHLSHKEIMQFLPQLAKYSHALITNGVDGESLTAVNRDIQTGDCRHLDLTRPPFNLPLLKVLVWRFGPDTKLTLYGKMSEHSLEAARQNRKIATDEEEDSKSAPRKRR